MKWGRCIVREMKRRVIGFNGYAITMDISHFVNEYQIFTNPACLTRCIHKMNEHFILFL